MLVAMANSGSAAGTFRALVTTAKKVPATVQSLSDSALPATSGVKAAPGDCDTLIKVDYSTLNFKDAMVVTGGYPGLKMPMVGGIDLSGQVITTSNPNLKEGQKVLINGFGMGTDHFGGFAEKASVVGDWCLPLSEACDVSPIDAARIGTAGYTAMLCVDALTEKVKADAGPVVVTGATGGVGSVAVSLLTKLGYHVVAATGKVAEQSDYLKRLGAKDIIDRSTLCGDPKPLGRTNYACAVDTVGGNMLANVLSELKYGGTAAACGMAGNMALPASVAPFILRGVSLLGIDSVFQPMQNRKRVYQKYTPMLVGAGQTLEMISGDQVIDLDQLPETAALMLKGQHKGRYVVKL